MENRRTRQKTSGMKQLRMWVRDPNTPEFRREAKRQAVLLRGAPEEAEALVFIERHMDQTDWTA
jgi:hypothetical protein